MADANVMKKLTTIENLLNANGAVQIDEPHYIIDRLSASTSESNEFGSGGPGRWEIDFEKLHQGRIPKYLEIRCDQEFDLKVWRGNISGRDTSYDTRMKAQVRHRWQNRDWKKLLIIPADFPAIVEYWGVITDQPIYLPYDEHAVVIVGSKAYTALDTRFITGTLTHTISFNIRAARSGITVNSSPYTTSNRPVVLAASVNIPKRVNHLGIRAHKSNIDHITLRVNGNSPGPDLNGALITPDETIDPGETFVLDGLAIHQLILTGTANDMYKLKVY